MYVLLIWLLLGSVGLNLMWIDLIVNANVYNIDLNKGPKTYELFVGLLIGLFLGPVTLLKALYVFLNKRLN